MATNSKESTVEINDLTTVQTEMPVAPQPTKKKGTKAKVVLPVADHENSDVPPVALVAPSTDLVAPLTALVALPTDVVAPLAAFVGPATVAVVSQDSVSSEVAKTWRNVSLVDGNKFGAKVQHLHTGSYTAHDLSMSLDLVTGKASSPSVMADPRDVLDVMTRMSPNADTAPLLNEHKTKVVKISNTLSEVGTRMTVSLYNNTYNKNGELSLFSYMSLLFPLDSTNHQCLAVNALRSGKLVKVAGTYDQGGLHYVFNTPLKRGAVNFDNVVAVPA